MGPQLSNWLPRDPAACHLGSKAFCELTQLYTQHSGRNATPLTPRALGPGDACRSLLATSLTFSLCVMHPSSVGEEVQHEESVLGPSSDNRPPPSLLKRESIQKARTG